MNLVQGVSDTIAQGYRNPICDECLGRVQLKRKEQCRRSSRSKGLNALLLQQRHWRAHERLTTEPCFGSVEPLAWTEGHVLDGGFGSVIFQKQSIEVMVSRLEHRRANRNLCVQRCIAANKR